MWPFKRRRKDPITVTVPALYDAALREPHQLIAGATGSGKSVIINGMIYAVLTRSPADRPNGAQLILIDPKRVELSQYRRCPHTISYASEPDDMYNALELALDITENRFRAMQHAGIRKYIGADIYVVIDELADLMTTDKRRVKPLLQRLAQIGRAARVHLIAATQCPISAVIPTEIKCNFDTRFALRTRSAQDSRNIIGCKGCETLPRYGQAYRMTPEAVELVTIPMVNDDHIMELVEYWTT